MNLGLKADGCKIHDKVDSVKYILTEEERKVQFEKIKALSDQSINEEKA
jgi:hypothetical protein